ncbi:MAG: GrpB family protein [Algicola sp.]|nr:GrpB family protein [Algicola sp.]
MTPDLKSSTKPTIEIVAPNPNWPQQFETIAKQIRAVVGSTVERIDHVGSTAVAGLAAKDIIDIQLTVTDIDDHDIIERLKDAGFEHKADVKNDLLVGVDDDSPQLRKHYFKVNSFKVNSFKANSFKSSDSNISAHIHIRQQGRLNQQYPLVFRDYLRSDAVTREAYSTIKKELATRFNGDKAAYYAIKDPYMDTIYQAAMLWVKSVDWRADDVFV